MHNERNVFRSMLGTPSAGECRSPERPNSEVARLHGPTGAVVQDGRRNAREHMRWSGALPEIIERRLACGKVRIGRARAGASAGVTKD